MLLLFGQAGEPVDAYIIFNFRQVSDVVLLITYEGKQRTPCKTILHQADDGWTIVEGDENLITGDNLDSINMALKSVSDRVEPINTINSGLFRQSYMSA